MRIDSDSILIIQLYSLNILLFVILYVLSRYCSFILYSQQSNLVSHNKAVILLLICLIFITFILEYYNFFV